MFYFVIKYILLFQFPHALDLRLWNHLHIPAWHLSGKYLSYFYSWTCETLDLSGQLGDLKLAMGFYKWEMTKGLSRYFDFFSF